MQHDTKFRVTDRIGSAGSITVDLNTTAEEFIGWYVGGQVNGEFGDVTSRALKEVLLHLQTGGRYRYGEVALGLKVEAIRDKRQETADLEADVLGDMGNPMLRVLRDGRRVWDYGRIGKTSGVRLGVMCVHTGRDYSVIEYNVTPHNALAYFVIRGTFEHLDEAATEAQRIMGEFEAAR